MLTQRFWPLFSLILYFSGWKSIPVVVCRVQCSSDVECEAIVREGSECLNGVCTNPYHRGGCLRTRLKNHYKVRTCHSEDPPSSVEKGYCVPSTLDYTEVRIATQNWESAFFESWILQIILSELMNVPVSLETGTAEASLNFYDLNTSFDYGLGNHWDQLRVSNVVKDCRKVKNAPNYTACSHVIPEAWSANQASLNALLNETAIEAPGDLGTIGFQSWFVRKNTGKRYPELLSYIGMRGAEGRKKLAKVFKRPTTWAEYCNLVSANRCQVPDNYASRAPMADEDNLYFDATYYKGYFRATEKNNCTGNPNCTGHIVDYPCGWTSHVAQQTYFNDIALESNGREPFCNGYTYSEMTQIWRAADALDADVVMVWWRPEVFYQTFLGTSSAFTVVTLPPPTQNCLENRVFPANRCNEDPVLRLGNSLGACDDQPSALFKVVATALYEISFDSSKPEALHSPAYAIIKNFRISELQIGEIFNSWFSINKDRENLDPRDAVCDWVVKNLDKMKSYIPDGYPRTAVDKGNIYHNAPIFLVDLVLSCLAIFAAITAIAITCLQRKKSFVLNAQIEFLFLLFIGLLLVACGAMLTSQPPTNSVCIAVAWFVNIGYAVELVPLVLKVAAINRQMVASSQMQRVKLKMSSLIGSVLLCVLLVGVTLVAWTVTDPPRVVNEFILTSDQTENGEIIVDRIYACGITYQAWFYVCIAWQLILLLCGSVLVFQARNKSKDPNEAKTLGFMIYSQLFFLVIRVVTYLLSVAFYQSVLDGSRGIIYSVDVIVTLTIYFVPKVVQKEEATVDGYWNGSYGTSS